MLKRAGEVPSGLREMVQEVLHAEDLRLLRLEGNEVIMAIKVMTRVRVRVLLVLVKTLSQLHDRQNGGVQGRGQSVHGSCQRG